MADIRNDQFLHRPGAGRGAITPTDPLEARLYNANGEVVSDQSPLEVRVRRLEELIGELQETPTPWTLADRIKRLETLLSSGDAKMQLTGQTVAEVKTQADAVGGVVTFSSPITAVEILNLDSVNHGTFTVNGLAITVPRGSAYRSYIGGTPGTTVSVAGSTQYEIRRLV